MEFAPQTLEAQSVQETAQNQRQLAALRAESNELAATARIAEAGYQTLTGREIKPAPVLGSDGKPVVNGKGEPLTVEGLQAQLGDVLKKQTQELEQLKAQNTSRPDADLKAKIAIKEAGLSALQLQQESYAQQNARYKLQQYATAKKEYRAQTAALFHSATGPLSAEDIQKNGLTPALTQAQAAAARFTELSRRQAEGQPVDRAELQQSEQSLLLAHRELANGVKAINSPVAAMLQNGAGTSIHAALTSALIDSLDRNKDGTLTAADFDRNGDGKLDKNEVRDFTKAYHALMRMESTDPRIAGIIAQSRKIGEANGINLTPDASAASAPIAHARAPQAATNTAPAR